MENEYRTEIPVSVLNKIDDSLKLIELEQEIKNFEYFTNMLIDSYSFMIMGEYPGEDYSRCKDGILREANKLFMKNLKTILDK